MRRERIGTAEDWPGGCSPEVDGAAPGQGAQARAEPGSAGGVNPVSCAQMVKTSPFRLSYHSLTAQPLTSC